VASRPDEHRFKDPDSNLAVIGMLYKIGREDLFLSDEANRPGQTCPSRPRLFSRRGGRNRLGAASVVSQLAKPGHITTLRLLFAT
jgi:hypothetical protein